MEQKLFTQTFAYARETPLERIQTLKRMAQHSLMEGLLGILREHPGETLEVKMENMPAYTTIGDSAIKDGVSLLVTLPDLERKE